MNLDASEFVPGRREHGLSGQSTGAAGSEALPDPPETCMQPMAIDAGASTDDFGGAASGERGTAFVLPKTCRL